MCGHSHQTLKRRQYLPAERSLPSPQPEINQKRRCRIKRAHSQKCAIPTDLMLRWNDTKERSENRDLSSTSLFTYSLYRDQKITKTNKRPMSSQMGLWSSRRASKYICMRVVELTGTETVFLAGRNTWCIYSETVTWFIVRTDQQSDRPMLWVPCFYSESNLGLTDAGQNTKALGLKARKHLSVKSFLCLMSPVSSE